MISSLLKAVKLIRNPTPSYMNKTRILHCMLLTSCLISAASGFNGEKNEVMPFLFLNVSNVSFRLEK